MRKDEFPIVDKLVKDSVNEALAKIKAEIEQITDTMGVSYNQYVSKIDILKIIDKYIEREGK